MLGTVFLDEIGEVDLAIQVKLLRIVIARVQPAGRYRDAAISGQIDRRHESRSGRRATAGGLWQDLYYRLCSDVIHVPTLHERLADAPQELAHLVHHMASRLVGDEAGGVVNETLAAIERHLGPAYPWPGNCASWSNACVMFWCGANTGRTRNDRGPSNRACRGSGRRPTGQRSLGGHGSASATGGADSARCAYGRRIIAAYCTIMYAQCGSYDAPPNA